jgi:hypothetical protein
MMLKAKASTPHRKEGIYINSIRQLFEKKSSKIYLKRFETAPDQPVPFFPSKIRNIPKSYETVNARQSGELRSAFGPNLIETGNIS